MSAGARDEILASLRRTRTRARSRARMGLLDEAIETMAALGFDVVKLADGDAVVSRVLEIVPAGATVVSHPNVVGRALKVDQVLRSRGRRVVLLPGDGQPQSQNGDWRGHLLAAQFGITGANALVADTGTIVLVEELGFGRAASNVPPVHIALTTSDSVVENLLDAAIIARGYGALHLDPAAATPAIPRYVSMISGPSKTADIGFTLVRGMHGPGAVHVLIWDHPKAEGMDDAALGAWVLA